MSWGCGLDNWGELTTFLLLCPDCLKFPQIVNRPRRQRVPARQMSPFCPSPEALSELGLDYNNSHYCNLLSSTILGKTMGRIRPLVRMGRADTRWSKRGNHVLFVDALVCGHQPQDAVEGTDSHGAVIGNREALREWFICLQDDMTTLLMDLAIVPMFAERLNDRAARELARDFHVARTSSRTRRRRMRTASFSG